MKRRCVNQRCTAYDDYGGRGIRVCDEWANDYVAFREWAISSGYSEELEIDRKDNDGHYEPGNCRWVSRAVNNRNTRKNHLVTAFGNTLCVAEWAKDSRCAVTPTTLADRLKGGWEPEKAIATPPLSYPRQPRPMDYPEASVVTQV